MSNAQIDKKELLKWAIVLAVAAMIWLIPCNMLYTIEVKKFLLVTVTGILGSTSNVGVEKPHRKKL